MSAFRSGSSPSKSGINPMASPRSSPRSLRSPRGAGGGAASGCTACCLGFLWRAKFIFVLLAGAVMLWMRPSRMDPDSNWMAFSGSGFQSWEVSEAGIDDAPRSVLKKLEFVTPDLTITIAEPVDTADTTSHTGSIHDPPLQSGKDSKSQAMNEERSAKERTGNTPPNSADFELAMISDDEPERERKDSNADIDEEGIDGEGVASSIETISDDEPSEDEDSASPTASPEAIKTSSNKGFVSLSSYDPARHPLIPLPTNETSNMPMASMPAADVHLVVDISSGASIQSKFLLDGLERSPHVNVVGMTFLNPKLHRVNIGKKTSSPMVWMVDWGSMQRDCHRLQKAMKELNRKESEYIILVDYSGSTRQSICESVFPKDSKIRLAKRSIVEGRRYDHLNREIVPGQIAENSAKKINNETPVMQAAMVVREKFASAIRSNTREQNPMKTTRKTDLCHFWRPGDYSHYSFWRRDVGLFVEKLGDAFNYTTLVEMVANDSEGMEDGNIQLKYVYALLHCKIVILAQRDEWEDHLRLYESLASGALVIMDPMLAPPQDLKNKTNVMVYESLEKLESLIHYYLEHKSRRKSVARRGMELIMGQHRSWHRVEQLLFGQPLHQVGIEAAYMDPPPKMKRPTISLVDGKMEIPT